MSKHKKRVNLGQRPAEQQIAPPVRPSPPPEAAPAAAVEDDTLSLSADESELATDESLEAMDEQAGETTSALESHPLFWFVLGALTVGIIVLLGLLLMGTGSASPAAQAAPSTRAVARVATSTPVSRATAAVLVDQPDVYATITAAAIVAGSVPRISLDQARKKMDAGAAIMVDVRSNASYTEMHIKGAINIPETDTAARLAEFPKDKEIILYCG